MDAASKQSEEQEAENEEVHRGYTLGKQSEEDEEEQGLDEQVAWGISWLLVLLQSSTRSSV